MKNHKCQMCNKMTGLYNTVQISLMLTYFLNVWRKSRSFSNARAIFGFYFTFFLATSLIIWTCLDMCIASIYFVIFRQIIDESSFSHNINTKVKLPRSFLLCFNVVVRLYWWKVPGENHRPSNRKLTILVN